MIKFNSNNINDWYDGSSVINKAYFNGNVVYIRIYAEPLPPPHTPCYAVVDNITGYSETDFVDVYNQADSSWYKLNNLDQFEKYGLYGTSTGVSETYYEGKLVVDNGYEYVYSGSSWVSLGEVSGSSRIPQGYTEYDYVNNNSTAYVDTGLLLYSATTDTFKIESTLYSTRVGSQTYQNIFCCMTEAGEPYQGFTYRFEGSSLRPRANPSSDIVFSTVNNGDGTSAATITCSTGITYTHDYPLVIGCGLDGSKQPFRFTNTSIYSFKVTFENTLILDYVPCKRNSDDTYGFYDTVGNAFVASSNSNPFTGGSPSTAVTYPEYYEEKDAPPNNLVFADMKEANLYPCPWVGMTALIDGIRFYYTSNYKWELEMT